MTYEELRDKMFTLLNEAEDMSATDVMAVVALIYEHTKYNFTMALYKSNIGGAAERPLSKFNPNNHEDAPL